MDARTSARSPAGETEGRDLPRWTGPGGPQASATTRRSGYVGRPRCVAWGASLSLGGRAAIQGPSPKAPLTIVQEAAAPEGLKKICNICPAGVERILQGWGRVEAAGVGVQGWGQKGSQEAPTFTRDAYSIPGAGGTRSPPACAPRGTQAWEGPGSGVEGAALLPLTLPDIR